MWLADVWRYFMLWLGKGTPTEWGTEGPSDQDHPVPTVENLIDIRNVKEAPPPWDAGWWIDARKTPAHPDRIGLPIVPQAVVVHTTDTYPGGFPAIVKSWTNRKGKGNAAHFMIGRTEADGVVQFAPITRNANHAGGKTCGHWRHGSRTIHPNTVAVGIELDAGGRLKKDQDGFYHPDTGKNVPLADVHFDSRGRAWHKVTEYQLHTLRKLLDDLNLVVKQMPASCVPVPREDYRKHGVAHYAQAARNYIVGHVTLDPINKLDPGPQVMDWLRKYYP